MQMLRYPHLLIYLKFYLKNSTRTYINKFDRDVTLSKMIFFQEKGYQLLENR